MNFNPEMIERLRKAQHIIVFTGAGVSEESGIPTFRDALTGLWEKYDAELLATPQAFAKDPDLVWGWYEWRRALALRCQPNPAHNAIASIAGKVPKLTVITQNVDDLHERADSENVIHLHGSLHAPRCRACGRSHALPRHSGRTRWRPSTDAAQMHALRRPNSPWRCVVWRRASARKLAPVKNSH